MFIPLHDRNALHYVRWQYVTLGLILANLLVFLISGGAGDGQVLQRFALTYGLIPGSLLSQSPDLLGATSAVHWSNFISYAFLHGGWMHLIGNMAFLWVFGDNIEDAMGHARFLVFYCLCAAGAALLHALANWGSPVPLIGASGHHCCLSLAAPGCARLDSDSRTHPPSDSRTLLPRRLARAATFQLVDQHRDLRCLVGPCWRSDYRSPSYPLYEAQIGSPVPARYVKLPKG